MGRGLFGDPMGKLMYENALLDLYNGSLWDVDRKIFALAPLPSSLTDTFSSRDTDIYESMKITYRALTAWIEEAKKADYFTRHFLTLSKLILNGVNTMGRCLVTLHARGEDLSAAPMSLPPPSESVSQ